MKQVRRFAISREHWQRAVAIGLLCAVLDTLVEGPGVPLHAQTTNVTSSGLHTAISSSGTTTFIDGGTRPGGGPNLFHSFGELNVGTGDTAQFVNGVSFDGAGQPLTAGLPTSNIFGRVTGNSLSSIFGTIDSATNFPTANFWLINPNGFLFGPTAALNVGGSVNISTADYLKMTDGKQFFADASKNSVLSMEPVAAFGFTAPRPITIQGSALAVAPGQSLSIVGGGLDISGRLNEATKTPEGFLFAPSGRIQLASVASPGEVVIGMTGTGAPDLNVDAFSQLGNITLSKVAILNASGDPGGTVQIRAGSLTVDRSFIASNTLGNISGAPTAVDLNVAGRILLQNGSSITSDTLGGGRSGDIVIKSGTLGVASQAKILSSTRGNGNAGDVSISAASFHLADPLSQIGSETRVGIGNAGILVIDASTVDITNGAGIRTATFGQGNAGPVTIMATEAVRVSGLVRIGNGDVLRSVITSSTVGSGAGDKVTITAPLISIADQGEISSGSLTSLSGRAGDVLLDGRHVTIDGGARVTSSTSSNASGGTVTIQASDSVSIANAGSVSADTFGDGNAGQVIIGTPTLLMWGGIISGLSGLLDPSTGAILPNSGRSGGIDIAVRKASLTADARIQNGTFTNGEGGSLGIRATEGLELSGSTISSSTLGGAKAGAISVSAPSLTLMDEASITANSSGAGQAGSVTVQAARMNITGGSSVDSNTVDTGLGGSVTITATEQVRLTGSNGKGDPSQITASTGGHGAAGQISVTTPILTLEKGAIFTNTGASGKAGSVTVNADQVSLTDGALISSRGVKGATGDAGSVALQIKGLFSSQASTVSSEAKSGAGGNVSITGGNLQLTDGTTILAKTTGSKNAGSIALTSGSDIVMRNTTVTTSADQASGGNIKLTAPNVISLFDSQLTSSVKGQVGSNGGNISIDPVAVSIQNSQLLANANAGAGGNINIVASGAVLVSPSSALDASAGPAGVPGRINIASPIQVLGGTLVPLKVSYSQPALSGDRCAADPQGQFSSFVQTGRDGVPQIPGGYSPSPLLPMNRLVSISRGAQGPRLAAARLGLDRMSIGTAIEFQFQPACRS